MKLLCAAIFAALVGLLFLRGLHDSSYSWSQTITTTVQTPDGLVDIATTQTVTVDYFQGGDLFTGTEVKYEAKGQAGYVQLSDGTYLFALLQGAGLAEGVFHKLRGGDRGSQLKRIIKQIDAPSESIPKKYWPRIVSFSNLQDPESVQPAFGESNSRPGLFDSDIEFGLGYFDPHVKDVSIEISKKRDITFDILKILPWLSDNSGFWLCPDNREDQLILLCRELQYADFFQGN